MSQRAHPSQTGVRWKKIQTDQKSVFAKAKTTFWKTNTGLICVFWIILCGMQSAISRRPQWNMYNQKIIHLREHYAFNVQFPCWKWIKTLKNLSNLVDVMQSNDSVKQCVEIVEQVDHLDGLAESWDGGETNNVTEVQSDLVEVLWFDRFARLQCLGYRPAREQVQIVHTRNHMKSWFNLGCLEWLRHSHQTFTSEAADEVGHYCAGVKVNRLNCNYRRKRSSFKFDTTCSAADQCGDNNPKQLITFLNSTALPSSLPTDSQQL